MKTLFFILLMVFCLTVTSCSKDDDPIIPPTSLKIGKVGDTLLAPNLENVLTDYDIPALAAMTMNSNGLLEKAAVGSYSTELSMDVDTNNKWHVGSITKSMTATLVGILVEKGHLEWTTTIGDVASEGYLEDYKDVNFIQLLSHTSGISPKDYPVEPFDIRETSEIRLEWAIASLNQPRGSGFAYSNNGYVVAGVMLELIMQDSWENLMVAHLFEPLGMRDTHFGAPGNNGGEQPWGHQFETSGWVPKDPMLVTSDNPAALGPGGTVHTTLDDLGKYIQLHMGNSAVITQTTLEMLHKEVDGSGYALGWNVNQSGIYHSGSNTRWFAQLYISADGTFSNFAVTNSYDIDGKKSIPAVIETLSVMGKRYENSL